MNIVRTLTIFMLLAALSFVLGFFVLAPLMPGSSKPTAPTGTAASAPTSVAQNKPVSQSLPPSASGSTDSSNAQKASPDALSNGPQPDAAARKVTASPGPSLDPEGGDSSNSDGPQVQTPRNLGEPASSATSSSREQNPVDVTKKGDNSAGDAARPAPGKETPTAHGRRHKIHRPAPTPELPAPQDPSPQKRDRSTDADPAPEGTPRTHRTRRPSPEAPAPGDQGDTEKDAPGKDREAQDPGTGLYHVQLGSFHSHDAAVQEVERARSKGFSVQIVPVTRRGRTLYRVQAGAFRERARAEAVKQSLNDADVEAHISDPER